MQTNVQTQSQKKQPLSVSGGLNELIVDAIQDIKGKNIIVLDMRHLHDSPTDYFIICEGESNVQVKAIGENVYKKLKSQHGIMPNHIEGALKAQWVLVDYFSTVVHVFHKEARTFYELEDLWSDAHKTEFADV